MSRVWLPLVLAMLAATGLQGQRKPWWSLAPLARVEPPAATGHPVDAFLRQKLEAKGLTFAPRADHRTLIRRLYFDLTGLPPRPEDLETSYEATVEKLLASPAYGERWGRHWLDIVRFGETDGGEHNYERPHAWRYRDYVIRSFNQDKPYPQFIREQLAGDLLDPNNPEMVAATGFLVAGPWDQVQAELNKDKVMAMTQRMDELDDMVTTTTNTFLGLTVNCARCHDHKFDPIPQRDYYRLTAVFSGVGFGNRPVAPAEQRAQYEAAYAPLKKALDDVRARLTALEEPVRFRLLEPRYRALDQQRRGEPQRLSLNPVYNHNWFAPVAAKQFRLVLTAAENKPTPKLRWLVAGKTRIENWQGRELPLPGGRIEEIEFAGTLSTYELQASDDGSAWRTICSSLDHVGSNELEMPTVTEQELDTLIDRQPLLAERARVQKAIAALPAPPLVYSAKPKPQVEKAYLLERGSVAKPLEEVAPGALSAVNALPADLTNAVAPDRERRLALADWIASPQNPLTARVIVNRVWMYHFGAGIVNTPSDLGLMGDRPSHPELLDYLAQEFIAHGWSIKWLHRFLLSTEAYRQSSAHNEKAFAVDGANRLLWHMPLKRMDAEMLRDSILAVSGKLDESHRGGPGFELQKKEDRGAYIYKALSEKRPETFRRSVYRFSVRGGERIFLDGFDCPDPSVQTPQRSVSNTPVQALTLMNNEFVVEQAAFLAARASNIDALYQTLFQRAPTPRERQLAEQFLAGNSLAAYARVLLNSNEFAYVP